jgi:hypothetical protein
MLEELEVLKIVSERLEAAQLPFMLTGSFAMAYYGKPRMTRDLDIVVSLNEDDVRRRGVCASSAGRVERSEDLDSKSGGSYPFKACLGERLRIGIAASRCSDVAG